MRYNDLVPQGTFISDYMESMSAQETARAYDFWTAMWLLSLACGREVVVARPRAPVYLNMYVILVAESGTTRKSTSVRQASTIAHLLKHPLVGLVESRMSFSGIETVLAERTDDTGSGQLAICISELASAFGRHSIGVTEVLTDVYDCPSSRSGGYTVTRGYINYRNVWVSLLSASTPTWLFNSVTPAMVEGGFTSRCYFIVSETPKARIAWPSDEPVDLMPFVNHLETVIARAQQFKEIGITKAGLETFTTWYKRRRTHADPFRASYEAREDAHALRIAALLCINDNSWEIQHKHINLAVKMATMLKADAYRLFTGTHDRSRWAECIEHIRAMLLANGTDYVPVSRLWLRTRRKMDYQEFVSLLETMHESGYIEKLVLPKRHEGRGGRPVEVIRGTRLIRSPSLIENIVTDY